MKGETIPIGKEQISQMCDDFYSSQIFGGEYPIELVVFDEITGINAQIQGADVFVREIWALRMELFGLAWCHYVRENKLKDVDEMAALAYEIICTKTEVDFLPGGNSIWNAMRLFNEAMRNDALIQETREDWSSLTRVSSIHSLRPQRSEEEVKKRAEWRTNQIDELTEGFSCLEKISGLGKECAKHLANRYYSSIAWQDGIELSQQLTLAFAQRIGAGSNLDVFLLLQRVIKGTYVNAQDFIEAVMSAGSWELHLKRVEANQRMLVDLASELKKQQGTGDNVSPYS